MGVSSVKIRLLLALILPGIAGVAQAQDPQLFGNDPEFPAKPLEDVEKLPEFRIEVIGFLYNAFDPTEEQFSRDPDTTLLEILPTDTPEPASFENTDPYRQTPGPLSTEPEPPLDDPRVGLESATPLPGEEALDETLEEEPGIAEQMIATLLLLEEEPDPLDPLQPDASMDTASTDLESAADSPPVGADEDTSDSPVEPRTAFDSTQSAPQETEPPEDPFRFRILRAEELELRQAYSILENLDAYTPLFHGGWVQEGLPEERAHPFHLSLLGALNPVGTVQLHLSRFLHVTVDLDYQARPEPPIAPEFSFYDNVLEEVRLPPRYGLQTQRRTRSGELHYFDHPAFGVLVIVRPQPEEPVESEEADELLGSPLEPAA